MHAGTRRLLPCGVGAGFAVSRFTMTLRIVYGACLAGLLVAAPAASQSVTADALASFVEESDSPDQFMDYLRGETAVPGHALHVSREWAAWRVSWSW